MSLARQLILPGYAFLCLLVGGSSQAIWGNALLQLLAVAILVWAALVQDPQPISRSGRLLLQLVGAAVVLLLFQIIPLPPFVWTALPGREIVEQGFTMLGMSLPWMPISLSPVDTLTTSLTLLPPLALLVGMMRVRFWTADSMFAAIIAGAGASILLGILQVSGSETSGWYLYQRTNLGVAVGAFANGNHFATLLLAALPLMGALAAAQWRVSSKREQRSMTIALAIAGFAILATGIFVNRSSAMLLLGPPIAIATALLAVRWPPRRLGQGLAVAGLLLLAAGASLAIVGERMPAWGIKESVETRTDYWGKAFGAVRDQAPAGSGIGTFEQVYRQYENPAEVDRWYINHAHNDYLELALEGGLPAIVLVILFLWWWGRRASQAWVSPAELEQKAAAIASAAILMHSAIDYPLRTAAISAVLAVCLALLAGATGARKGAGDALERPRHATL